MRGMEKIIMSNFPARSTQIQHKSDFVQFAIYKKNLETMWFQGFSWWRIAGSNR